MPPQSATKTAVRDSLTPAEQAALTAPTGHGPWSSTDLLLATVADALHVLVWQQTQIHGKKRSRAPKPIPRPGVTGGNRSAGTRSNDGRVATERGVTYLSELRERRRRNSGN